MRTERVVMLLGVALGLAACSTPLSTREKGALAGGAVGAGAGAAIGSASGHAGAGALIGAGVGVLGGALIGDAMQANEQQSAAPPPVTPPPPVADSAPQYIWVPQWGVYVVEGYDIVYHNHHHYYWHGGRWYVARGHTGPWSVATAQPAVLMHVPQGRIHQRLPPSLQKQGRIPPGHSRR
jgi:hypothetical protein